MTDLHMRTIPLSRRGFLAASTAAAGGLSLGFHIPFAGEAAAQGTASGRHGVAPAVGRCAVTPASSVPAVPGGHRRAGSSPAPTAQDATLEYIRLGRLAGPPTKT